jgi:hypothetical protein
MIMISVEHLLQPLRFLFKNNPFEKRAAKPIKSGAAYQRIPKNPELSKLSP